MGQGAEMSKILLIVFFKLFGVERISQNLKSSMH